MPPPANGRVHPYPQTGRNSGNRQQNRNGMHIDQFLANGPPNLIPLEQQNGAHHRPPGTPQDTVDATTKVTLEGKMISQETPATTGLSTDSFPLLQAAISKSAASPLSTTPLLHASHLPPNTSATAAAHNTSQHASNSPQNNTASSILLITPQREIVRRFRWMTATERMMD